LCKTHAFHNSSKLDPPLVHNNTPVATAMSPPLVTAVLLLIFLTSGAVAALKILSKSTVESCDSDSGAGGHLSCRQKLVLNMVVSSDSVSTTSLALALVFAAFSDVIATAYGLFGLQTCRAVRRRRWWSWRRSRMTPRQCKSYVIPLSLPSTSPPCTPPTTSSTYG
jgi:hypothetical protein